MCHQTTHRGLATTQGSFPGLLNTCQKYDVEKGYDAWLESLHTSLHTCTCTYTATVKKKFQMAMPADLYLLDVVTTDAWMGTK